MLTNLRERLREAPCLFGRCRTWTTGEIDERIWFTFVARGRKDKNVETDLPAFFRAIFVDLESAALRRAFYFLEAGSQFRTTRFGPFCRTALAD